MFIEIFEFILVDVCNKKSILLEQALIFDSYWINMSVLVYIRNSFTYLWFYPYQPIVTGEIQSPMGVASVEFVDPREPVAVRLFFFPTPFCLLFNVYTSSLLPPNKYGKKAQQYSFSIFGTISCIEKWNLEFLFLLFPCQIIPILRAGLALAEYASSVLPATKMYHLGKGIAILQWSSEQKRYSCCKFV